MTETLYPTLLNDIRDAIVEVGTLARRAFYEQDGTDAVSGKARIDEIIERKIHQFISDLTPDFGFIAEECPELRRPPAPQNAHYWLLDPNDGTRPFQEGYRGPSISLALIRDDQPVLGVVYAYAARCGLGDLFEWAEGASLRRNGLYVQWQKPFPVALVSNKAEEKHAFYQEQFAPLRYQPEPGIAYRLALAACGHGTVAVSLGTPRDLDIAAGHALLLGAGLELYDLEGKVIRYGFHQNRTQTPVMSGPSKTQRNRPHPIAPNQISQRGNNPWQIVPSVSRQCTRPDVLDRLSGAFVGTLIADALAKDAELLQHLEETAWPMDIGGSTAVGETLIENAFAMVQSESSTALPHPVDGICTALPLLLGLNAQSRTDWVASQEEDMGLFCQWLSQHLFPTATPSVKAEVFEALEASINGAVSFLDGLNLAAEAGVVDRRFLWVGAILGARFGRNALPPILVAGIKTRRLQDLSTGIHITRPDILAERLICLEIDHG